MSSGERPPEVAQTPADLDVYQDGRCPFHSAWPDGAITAARCVLDKGHTGDHDYAHTHDGVCQALDRSIARLQNAITAEQEKAKGLADALRAARNWVHNSYCDDAETLEVVAACDAALAAWEGK